MTSLRRTAATALLVLLAACGGTSSPTAAPSAVPTPTAVEPSADPAPPPVRLTGDGIDLGPDGLLLFGTDVAEAEPQLVAALGEPTLDTGETDPGAYGSCPGSRLRALEFGDGALVVLFGDVLGPGLTLFQWSLTQAGNPLDVPPASALVGDTTTLEYRVGTPLGELRRGAAEGTLTVTEADELLEASFVLADQSAGFTGTLAGTTDADAVTRVQAGEACGE